MMARVTPTNAEPFLLFWRDGQVASDSDCETAKRCADYLNGTPTLFLGEPHEGSTDGHYSIDRALRSEEEFLLIAGSLADRFEVRVDLLGELSDADHEKILNNEEADRKTARKAIERAVESGMPLVQAERLYGFKRSFEQE